MDTLFFIVVKMGQYLTFYSTELLTMLSEMRFQSLSLGGTSRFIIDKIRVPSFFIMVRGHISPFKIALFISC